MIHSSQQKKSFTAQLWEIIGILLIVFLVRTFVFGLYQVPTGSMETTMLVGEGFFADKWSLANNRRSASTSLAVEDHWWGSEPSTQFVT